MLPTISITQIAHVLNEPEPRQFGSGSLEDSTCHVVFGLDIRPVGYYGIGLFQLKKYASCSMLLITDEKRSFEVLGSNFTTTWAVRYWWSSLMTQLQEFPTGFIIYDDKSRVTKVLPRSYGSIFGRT